MKKILYFTIILLLAILIDSNLHGDDYQYQYFNKDKKKYMPFSDYIPRIRRHYKIVPHYLEDYYELYGMKQHYNENSLRMNIARLERALLCKFRHPSMALVKVESEKEYYRYRNLMFMHINILIMRNYMRIASRYDKMRIYFYSSPFAKEIHESLEISEKFYKKAIPYWDKAQKYAKNASRVKITTDLGYIETERYRIIKGDLNFKKIINSHLTKVKRKQAKLKKMIAEQP